MYFSTPNPFDDIVKDIVESHDKEKAMEFTKKVGEMLKDYGVTPIMAEYSHKDLTGIVLSEKYNCFLTGFDFTEHDMPFESEISELKNELEEKEEELARCKRNECKMVVVAREINGVPYVTLEDFLEAVKN